MFIASEMFRGPTWGRAAVTPSEAKRLALQFAAHFANDAACYSTYHYTIDAQKGTYSGAGSMLLGTSFELGIMMVDSAHVGVLWIGDED